MTEVYSIITDFGGVDPNIEQLHSEIEADVGITKTLIGVTTIDDDTVHITFDLALSGSEKIILDGIVSAHVPVFIPPLNREVYDAVVNSTGAGDFTSIAEAFQAGNKSVFVHDGTYVETSDIVLPNTGKLVGESSAQFIISFGGTGSCIRGDGSGGTKEIAGTVSATNGSTNVVGSGTTFTNLSTGDYILLDQNFYEIASVTTDASLEIARAYRGRTFSGLSYIAQSMYLGITICNFIVTGSTGTGVYLRGLRSATITSVASVSNNIGFEMLDSSTNSFISCNAFNNTSYGFRFSDSYSVGTVNGESYNNNSNGFQIEGRCTNIILNGNLSANNNGVGVNIAGTSTNIAVNDCVIQRNNGKGINTDPSIGAVVIDGCTLANNASDGIDFDGSDNIVTSCHLCFNGGYGIQAGNNGVISGNHVNDNGNNGINLNGDSDCQVAANNINNNSGHGIYTNRHRNSVSGNSIRDNTGDGIHISGGDDNIISSNVIETNSGNAITLSGGSIRTNINANRIMGNVIGVDISSLADQTSVFDNIITGTSSNGISVSGYNCHVVGNITDSITGTGCIINSGANDTLLKLNKFDSFTNNGTSTNTDQTFVGDYNSDSGTDSGLVVPYGTFMYEINSGSETGSFSLSGPSAIAGQILNIRNNTGFATTGIVISANGGASYVYNGTSWIQVSST